MAKPRFPLTYDDWTYAGWVVRRNHHECAALDDLDIHDAAFAASRSDPALANPFDVFLAVIKRKFEAPPMFDGMTI